MYVYKWEFESGLDMYFLDVFLGNHPQPYVPGVTNNEAKQRSLNLKALTFLSDYETSIYCFKLGLVLVTTQA